jgi:hypothetical protein
LYLFSAFGFRLSAYRLQLTACICLRLAACGLQPVFAFGLKLTAYRLQLEAYSLNENH